MLKNFFKFFLIFFIINANSGYAQDQQIIDFYKTIRCLVCDGQSIYDSETIFAQNLREQIASKFETNMSKKDIKRDLLKIYGEDISFEPTEKRIVLWLFPFVILFLIVFINHKRFKRRD